MSTPLLKNLKNKGSSFYAFASTSQHPNPNFSKFVLINLPAKVTGQVLDFNDINNSTGHDVPSNSGFNIYTDRLNPINTYAEQLIDSLRSYVENYDVTVRESKLNQYSDFYNINESITDTEAIFFKWLRKFGAIDFEPAQHLTDWDKTLPDFTNPNADTVTNSDYFRKYLWKEREVIPYSISNASFLGVQAGYGNYIVSVVMNEVAKFKSKIPSGTNAQNGDLVVFNGTGLSTLPTGITYEVVNVINTWPTSTEIWVNLTSSISNPTGPFSGTTTLSYNRVVQYIGEINVQSDVHTATVDETEVMAYIPHQAGATPTILFTTMDNHNYYPGLELPILPEQIQTEIRGAENMDSPIRTNPQDYPGSYYGQFDSINKTYVCSSGDKLRYSGNYYGILLNNNAGLSNPSYIEPLSSFNAENIDGITLDFNLTHYLKMTIPPTQVGFNFDQFNQLPVDNNPPKDFNYNCVLWYYEIDNGNGIVSENLYGITFLNNPGNDWDTNSSYISPYTKLVCTDQHDGLSYQHALNTSMSVDSDTSSLSFDPLSLYNSFGFDLYSNVMSNLGKLNESFINIINDFLDMNTELNNVKSLIYTQTDIDLIKNKLLNLENLLQLYSTYQFVDSDSVKIVQNYGGVYPTLSFDLKAVEYETVYNIDSAVINSNKLSTGADYPITVPSTNKMFVRIKNVDTTGYGDLGVLLSNDLTYKQSVEFYIDANNAFYSDNLSININYNDGSVNGVVATNLIIVPLPTDTASLTPLAYNRNRYISTSMSQNVTLVSTTGSTTSGQTVLYTDAQNLFGNLSYSDKVYVQDLIFTDGTNYFDFSAMYDVNTTDFNQAYFKIDLNTYGLTPVGNPRVWALKGMKITILRVDSSATSSISDRYLIQKSFI